MGNAAAFSPKYDNANNWRGGQQQSGQVKKEWEH